MTFRFGGNIASYKRTSNDYAVLGGETFIEVDTDSGPKTVTLPLAPLPLETHEVYSLGGETVTINGAGQAINGPYTLTSGSLLLTWIPPVEVGGGGYWYSRRMPMA